MTSAYGLLMATYGVLCSPKGQLVASGMKSDGRRVERRETREYYYLSSPDLRQRQRRGKVSSVNLVLMNEDHCIEETQGTERLFCRIG